VTWWASNFDHLKKRKRFSSEVNVRLRQGLEVVCLGSPGYRRNVSLARWWDHRVLAARFRERSSAMGEKPDIIFASLPPLEMAEAAVEFGLARAVPVVVDVRDIWPDQYLSAFPACLRRAAKVVLASEYARAKRIFRNATGITAVSSSYLRWALALSERSSGAADRVCYLGYPRQQGASLDEVRRAKEKMSEQTKMPPGCFVLAFVGSFCSSFDFEPIAEAARATEREGISAPHFLVVGGGELEEKWRRMASGLTTVHFLGWQDQAGVAAALEICDLGLAPYRSEATQSLPNKPFEYMAARRPILSSLGGELAEVLSDHGIGLQYEAGSRDSLIEGIRWAMANRQELKEMGMRARRLFEERFCDEVVCAGLLDHMNAVVRGYRPGAGAQSGWNGLDESART
jgi:glycosyltransferase involved in cell wall biosynthesis